MEGEQTTCVQGLTHKVQGLTQEMQGHVESIAKDHILCIQQLTDNP
jgi:hypothetical protein